MSEVFLSDLNALAARVPDGAKVAVFKEMQPVAAARALVRRGARDLHLITVPTGSLVADLLIGAGCVSVIETSGVSLGEHGPAPCFVKAVKSGTVRPLDATCPAVYTGLQAAGKGIPFMPMRGLVGSDVLARRPDYKVIANPFAEHHDPIVAIPALRPDVALIHVPLADPFGNAWCGRWPELAIIAHAASTTLVTCEALFDGSLLDDERYAGATISSLYVSAIAPAERGSWPLAMPGDYAADADALADYARAARSGDSLAAWLRDRAPERRVAAE